MLLHNFFSTATAPTDIFTLSLHDALPILLGHWFALPTAQSARLLHKPRWCPQELWLDLELDRKSTRLNSSHVAISYAVFCLKKKYKGYIYELNYITYISIL